MARRKRASTQPQTEDGAMDMSPMIDMVFQLIIFFMVTATLVSLKKDPEVKVPVAPQGQRSDAARGKVVINVYSDEVMRKKGRTSPFATEDGAELSMAQITEMVNKRREANEAAGVTPTMILLRGDRASVVRRTKEAIAAAGAAQVNDIIFSAFQDEAPAPVEK